MTISATNTRTIMPFYRFEGLKTHRFNPHLSTAEGPVIEGEFMYFRMVTKRAGTGAELHYHPKYPRQKKDPAKSQAIIEGLGTCYYSMIGALDEPPTSGHSERWVEGAHIGFGFVESPSGHVAAEKRSAHEMFLYVIRGALDATVGGKRKRVGPGDVVHVPRTAAYRWQVAGKHGVRFAAVRSLPALEAKIRKNGAADNWRG